MLNAIPFVGWFLSLFFSISLAVPFWLVWSVCDIGETYFYWLPSVYWHPGFWSCVGLFMVAGILKSMAPTFISVSNNSESK
jgi:hypothetical protein